MAKVQKKQTKKDYTYATGKRKTASARVRLYKGDKESLVNGKVIGEYFPGEAFAKLWSRPFEITGTLGKYFVTAKISGGGRQSQIEALMHGIARALNFLDREKYRSPLKIAGLLTRDSRERERRMIGTGGKSRRRKQSPKR